MPQRVLRALRDAVVRLGRSFSPVGLAFALVGYCAAMTPSLIPRTWLFQAVIAGICAILGYGVGTFVVWVLRGLGLSRQWSHRTRTVAWWALAAAAVAMVPTYQVLGARWQSALRELFGLEPDPAPRHIVGFLVAIVFALAVLAVARGVRRLVRWVGRQLGRWVPARAAVLAAAVAVPVVLVLILNGTLVRGVFAGLDSIYGALDESTVEGVVPPTVPERSGSPASLVSWESLGRQGRNFTGRGLTAAEIADFVADRGADPAAVTEPIRVYAGLTSADTPEEVAQRVVDELDRTDAWSRRVLVVAVTTGTGWVDPSMSETIEYMYGGDTAIAGMQYSFLPSWVSFVSNREVPPAAGKLFFETVYAAWSALPEDDRPLLLVYGQSLGAFGGQGAFSGLQDMAERTDGALWIGTPGFTPNWQYLTANRDEGSPEISPVVDGGATARFSLGNGSAADLWDEGEDWGHPRVAYVQHGSDAVIWWSPDLFWHEPDWLREPRGPDVLDQMMWTPGVTFWQVSMDLLVAADVPMGFGHFYHLEYSDAFAAIAAPEGWTADDTAALKAAMLERPSES